MKSEIFEKTLQDLLEFTKSYMYMNGLKIRDVEHIWQIQKAEKILDALKRTKMTKVIK